MQRNQDYPVYNSQPQQQHMQVDPSQIDPVTGGLITQTPPIDPQQFAQGTQDAPGTPPATIVVEVPSSGAPTAPSGRLFTEAEVEAVRQQEKDKLYGRLTAQEQTVARLEEERKERERLAAESQQQAAEAERLRQEAEMDSRQLIEAKDKEWNDRFTALEQEREMERAVAERERESLQLQHYITQAQAANVETILPELLDMVGANCNTREEVDASLSALQARTASIVQNVASVGGGAPAPLPPKGASITAPPVGPVDAQSATRTFTPEEIKNMSTAEYAQHRSALLRGVGHQVSERGLYG